MTYGHMYKLNCSRPGVSVQTLRHHPTLARARDHGLPGGARLASQVEAEQEQQEIAEPEQQDVQNEETARQELIQQHTTFDESRCVLHKGGAGTCTAAPCPRGTGPGWRSTTRASACTSATRRVR